MTTLRRASRSAARPDVSPRLPELRAALVQQRRFRVDQLSELDAGTCSATASTPDEPRNQVALLVRAAALAALADIDAALDRMRLGCYGQCPSCGGAIKLERLEVLPMVTLCMPCQRAQEEQGLGRSSRARRSRWVSSPPDQASVKDRTPH